MITDSTDHTRIQNINHVMLMKGSQDNVYTHYCGQYYSSIRHELYYTSVF